MALYYNLVLTSLLLTVQSILPSIALVEGQNTNFSFPYFGTQDFKSFLKVEDVQHYAANSSFLLNEKAAALVNSSCGRLLYKEKVWMKDPASGAVASFKTVFTFKITGQNIYTYLDFGVVHGDGLAFTFAKNDSLLGLDEGSSLCLLQEQNNGLPSNRVFAVAFDTFQNYWWNDPSDSHVGVNVNSMNSTWYYNLCGFWGANCSRLCNGGYLTAWIDCDSTLQMLEVFLTDGSSMNDKPTTPRIVARPLPLSDILDDYMYSRV